MRSALMMSNPVCQLPLMSWSSARSNCISLKVDSRMGDSEQLVTLQYLR